ncbi:hypothetical protein SESBI_47057 [Sesbania bispinosa]|nr:hypothetical protein SESBI_47057 [Sesbania bispinosa]
MDTYLLGLKFEGEKFEVANIYSWENYDRIEAVKGVIKRGLQQSNKVNAGSLNVENRLLHYPLARILILQYTCQHMQKVKANKMIDLPYAILITKILEHYGVDTSKEGELTMTEHHTKVEKMIEELVNRIHGIENRLPPPTSG